jgi:bifunctional UDP-N-acetylglucosamine pyrophosphorylase/glucosamine-1-phosphate N-acetyltransferase
MVKSAEKSGAAPGAAAGVLLLAAGQGKRMRSSLPKVLHAIGGQPLLFHILDAVRAAAPGASVAIVVGHGREQVERAVREEPRFSGLDMSFVHQPEQKGTGHAARCAMESDWGARMAREERPVLVLPGDLPLIPSSMVEALLRPLGRGQALRLLTCELPDPTGYGRVVRRGKTGPVLRIVEQKDASDAQRRIREVAASIYTFAAPFLAAGVRKLSDRNAQKEYYLTDLVQMAAAQGAKAVDVLKWPTPEDVRGINDPWELAQAGRMLNERVLRRLALDGVRVLDPASTWIDPSVTVAPEATVHPGAILAGATRVAAGAVIGPRAVLRNVVVGEGAQVKTGTVAEASEIGARASVGPYAHLRPGSVVGPEAKIGNFVELKKTTVGAKSSIAHLSYLGDAEVGARVNIGCGFVTCNYDGRAKHRTIIEDDVFLGSDCQAVAPVRVGRGAYVGSGSTLTEDVPADALAIARSRQVNKPGYARKLRGEK